MSWMQVPSVVSSRVLSRTSRVASLQVPQWTKLTTNGPTTSTSKLFMSSGKERKAGVAEPSELREFVRNAGKRLLVVDVRNANIEEEPGDQKSLAVAPLPSSDGSGSIRPQAVNLVWNRKTASMPLPEVEKDTPIITHCGGGGRGQKAKVYLEQNGFNNVLNGGGPKETDCWAEYGDK